MSICDEDDCFGECTLKVLCASLFVAAMFSVFVVWSNGALP